MKKLLSYIVVVPFLLETILIEGGARFENSGRVVTVDQRVITGQNTQSAEGVREAILKESQNLK